MEKERSVDKKQYLMDSKISKCSVAYGKKDKETYFNDRRLRQIGI